MEVRSIVELVMSEFVIREEESNPEPLECTTPAVNVETVGAWATVKLVTVVVARVEVPVTPNVPPTVKRLEIVVEPVMANVLEAGLKVKLLEPAVLEAAVA